jgi:hypothetical protein
MDGFPLNLILAVATAAATIFIGFLPTKSISSPFFAKQTCVAIFAWALVAFTAHPLIIHYLLLLTFLCFASWWSFRRDRALSGKMWLSVASGLGISVGVMLILEVTPRAYPKGLPQLNEALLLASIYLGGAIIGLAYFCFALTEGTRSGVTQGLIQRYVELLLWLTVLRAVVILATFSIYPGYFGETTTYNNLASTSQPYVAYQTEGHLSMNALAVVISAVIILPLLAFFANRAASFSSKIQPTRALIAILCLGFLTEIGARYLLL